MREIIESVTLKSYTAAALIALILLFIPLGVNGVMKEPLVITVSNQQTGNPMKNVEFRVFNEEGELIDGGESGKDGKVGTFVPPGSSGVMYIFINDYMSKAVEYGPGKYAQNVSLRPQPAKFVQVRKSARNTETPIPKNSVTLSGAEVERAGSLLETIKNLSGAAPGAKIKSVDILPFGHAVGTKNQYILIQFNVRYDQNGHEPGTKVIDAAEPGYGYLGEAAKIYEGADGGGSSGPDNTSFGIATDIAGNITPLTETGVNIDKTAPVITANKDLSPGGIKTWYIAGTIPMPGEIISNGSPGTTDGGYGTSYSKGGGSGGSVWHGIGGGKPFDSTTEPEPVGSAGGGVYSSSKSGGEGGGRTKWSIWPETAPSVDIDKALDRAPNIGYDFGIAVVEWQPLFSENDIPLTGQKNAKPFPDDPLFEASGSWGQEYEDQWGLKRIGLTAKNQKGSVWDTATAVGEPVIVAVIDSGCDLSHPELKNAIWRNRDEIADNNKDDDNNGFIDDVYGWNFVEDSNDIRDFNGHGTVNSGIIAARINNGIGIAGINPKAQIMVVKALNFELKGGSINLGKAIIYAVNNGAKVINISIGGVKRSWFVQIAINYARQNGAVVVAASGNEGIDNTDYTPAGLTNVIAVAATDTGDRRTNFSNWGQAVDIAAPGVDILSLRAKGTDLLVLTGPDGYKPGSALVGIDGKYYRVNGTSFAAPFVSGVASLILSQNPTLTTNQVQRMILSSAVDIEIPGWDQYSGYGRLNAGAALQADPNYITVAKITGLVASERDGKPVLQIQGTAFSTDFASRWIELGFGDKPKKWRRIGKKMKDRIILGALGEIHAKEFKKRGTWSVRLKVRTKSHGEKEAWGSLDIK